MLRNNKKITNLIEVTKLGLRSILEKEMKVNKVLQAKEKGFTKQVRFTCVSGLKNCFVTDLYEDEYGNIRDKRLGIVFLAEKQKWATLEKKNHK